MSKNQTILTPQSAKSEARDANIYQVVDVRVHVTADGQGFQFRYSVPDGHKGIDDGDIEMGLGDWEIVFHLESSPDFEFDTTPIQVSPRTNAGPSDVETTFAIRRVSDDTASMDFTFIQETVGENPFGLRVRHRPTKRLVMHDPKVINRGYTGDRPK